MRLAKLFFAPAHVCSFVFQDAVFQNTKQRCSSARTFVLGKERHILPPPLVASGFQPGRPGSSRVCGAFGTDKGVALHTSVSTGAAQLFVNVPLTMMFDLQEQTASTVARRRRVFLIVKKENDAASICQRSQNLLGQLQHKFSKLLAQTNA
ncbi:hypothetical protein PC120_g15567 [Phytophthora cactorum]|nr:hypothetical protein PC120_g15567 [Phytophthora cactorum]